MWWFHVSSQQQPTPPQERYQTKRQPSLHSVMIHVVQTHSQFRVPILSYHLCTQASSSLDFRISSLLAEPTPASPVLYFKNGGLDYFCSLLNGFPAPSLMFVLWKGTRSAHDNLLFGNIFKYPTMTSRHLQDTVQTLPPFSSYPDLFTPQVSSVLPHFPVFYSRSSLLLTFLFPLKTVHISSKALFNCLPPWCSQAGDSLPHPLPRVTWHFSILPQGTLSLGYIYYIPNHFPTQGSVAWGKGRALI